MLKDYSKLEKTIEGSYFLVERNVNCHKIVSYSYITNLFQDN